MSGSVCDMQKFGVLESHKSKLYVLLSACPLSYYVSPVFR
jgi:hypothetical protein